MKGIKRFTSRISSSFEWVVSQLENHDALVTATIREVAGAAAQAKVQLKAVKRDGENLRARIARLEELITTWEERAKKSAQENEKKAIECIKRKRKCEQELSQLQEEHVKQKQVETQLQKELDSIEERLGKLRRQRNIMRTRQSRAEALQALPSVETELVSEIDDILERWDSKITEYELRSGDLGEVTDELEDEFSSAEEEEDMKAELEALMAS